MIAMPAAKTPAPRTPLIRTTTLTTTVAPDLIEPMTAEAATMVDRRSMENSKEVADPTQLTHPAPQTTPISN